MFMNYVQIILKRSIPMKPLVSTLIFLSTATGALAQADYSYNAMIETTGLSATATTLLAIPDPTPSDRFALGGVRFLAAIETALQTRYRTGMSGSLTMMADLPILRLTIPENPNPEPFDPAIIEQMFLAVTTDLDGAIAALDGIGDDDPVSVIIDTGYIWFDINMNATRDDGEGLAEVAGFFLSGGFDASPGNVTIRFDTSDAAWLSAYAHFLSGVSETLLAFSPTDSIARIHDATAQMQALSPVVMDPSNYLDLSQFGEVADLVAIVLGALEQQPDATRTRAAHAHFLSMIADNRTFWARVATETDNDAEWIPNKNQQSALPIPFPADTGARWQAVLSDAEAVLNGEQLIPHWRLGEGAGVNLARLFQDPPVLDVIGLVQGVTLVPYMEHGLLMDGTSLTMFDQLMQGDAGLFMVILN